MPPPLVFEIDAPQLLDPEMREILDMPEVCPHPARTLPGCHQGPNPAMARVVCRPSLTSHPYYAGLPMYSSHFALLRNLRTVPLTSHAALIHL